MKRLALLLALLLLALALPACGGGGEDASTTAASAARESGAQGEESAVGGESFTPKPHHDSGGGAAQFLVKGADNSVQEYGAEAGEEEFEEAAAALHGFLDARAQRAWAAACRYLAADLVASLEQAAQLKEGEGSCAGGLRAMTRPAALAELRREAAQADVGSVRVEGESGFVIYRGLEGGVYAIAIGRKGGEWKVAGLGGLALG